MTHYEELMADALETLETNDELFVSCIDEVIRWNGHFADEEVLDMDMLNEYFWDSKVTDFLDKVDRYNFDFSHDYWKFDECGNIITIEDKTDYYRDNIDCEELLDELISQFNHIYFQDSNFEKLLDEIINSEVEV